jgi:hypothetical protein
VSNRPHANPGPPVDLALAWNDHMARLLQHADSLLAEWEKAARRSGDTLAKSMKATVAEATPQIVAELRRSLAESLRQDLARVQRASAPRGWLVPVLAVANIALAVGLVLAMSRSPARDTAAAAPVTPVANAATPPKLATAEPNVTTPAPIVPATPAAAPLCEGLLKGAKGDARQIAAECARVSCGKDAARCDASLQVAMRARPKCKPKGDAQKGYAVDDAWLHECLKGK